MTTSSSIPASADMAGADDAAITGSIHSDRGGDVAGDAGDGGTDIQLAAGGGGNTVVRATPVTAGAGLPQAMGLSSRQRIALQALAGGAGPHAAADKAGVSVVTVFRWRKYDPRFIAALNVWKAESLKTAHECLAAAQEQAARTVLRAVQNGDVRAALAVLQGMGTLTPQKAGPEFAGLVEQQLTAEHDETRLQFRKPMLEMQRQVAEREREKQRAAEASAKAEEARLAGWRKFSVYYLGIAALPRPITAAAMRQAALDYAQFGRIDATRCTIAVVATAADCTLLVNKLVRDGEVTADQALGGASSLPWLLLHFRQLAQGQEYAASLEALGATVELRPAWTA